MPSLKQVLYAMQTCDTAADVQRECGISPYRLRHMLRSQRFRRQMELERQYADMRLSRKARDFVRPAAEALFSALQSRDEAELRKAAVEVLRLATRRPGVAPDISGPLLDMTKLPPDPQDAPPVGNPSETAAKPSETYRKPTKNHRKGMKNVHKRS